MDCYIQAYEGDSRFTLGVRCSIRDALRQAQIPSEDIERVLSFYASDIQQVAVPPPPLPPRLEEPELYAAQTYDAETSLRPTIVSSSKNFVMTDSSGPSKDTIGLEDTPIIDVARALDPEEHRADVFRQGSESDVPQGRSSMGLAVPRSPVTSVTNTQHLTSPEDRYSGVVHNPIRVAWRQPVAPVRIWSYPDPQRNTYSSLPGPKMHDWYKTRYFSVETQVKRLEDAKYEPLSQLIRRTGNSDEPFLVPQVDRPYSPIHTSPHKSIHPPVSTPSASLSPPITKFIPFEGVPLGPRCRLLILDALEDNLALMVHTYLECFRVRTANAGGPWLFKTVTTKGLDSSKLIQNQGNEGRRPRLPPHENYKRFSANSVGRVA